MTAEETSTISDENEEQTALPEGWRLVELAEACDFLDYLRKPISQDERNKRNAGKKEAELYPYYGANGQAGWIDKYIFDEPLILLAEDGGNFGSTTRPIAYKVTGKYWVNNHAHVLRPKKNVDLDYLKFSLSIRPDIANLVAGATRAKLNLETASKIEIPLPPTIEEQRRIAAVLDRQMKAVEAARRATEEQLAAIKKLPSALLRKAFAGEI